MKPNYVYPDSTSIYAYCYEESKNILTINFIGGSTYEYYKVPSKVFHEMLDIQGKGESIGKYFNKFIRPHYSYHQITEDEVLNDHKEKHKKA